MLLTNLLFFILACIVLLISGSWLVKLLSKIAVYLKLSEFVVAFIIMAFSTSIPELFVGINAALVGNPILSLGNVIGSNIVDISFIIGVTGLIARGLKVQSKHIKKDSLIMFTIALVPILLMIFDRTLSQLDGVILIAIFIVYMVHLIKERREFRREYAEEKAKDIFTTTLLFVASFFVLYFSSKYVVEYGTKLSIDLMLPAIFIGLFFVAIGTSLPELVFGIQAAREKRTDMAIGDSMGSVVCNSTLVLGLTAIIHPITGGLIFVTSSIFMVLFLALFVIYMRNKKGITLLESILFIILYVLFVIFELLLK